MLAKSISVKINCNCTFSLSKILSNIRI